MSIAGYASYSVDGFCGLKKNKNPTTIISFQLVSQPLFLNQKLPKILGNINLFLINFPNRM